ncbi:MAG: hypothetical protein AAFO69_12630 [Bacteroidota bacterium]
MKFLKLNILFIVVLFSACSSGPGSQELHKEVMNFHDEVMPYMGSLYKAEKKVGSMIAELDSTATGEKKVLQAQLDSLVKAQDHMNEWMRGFKTAYQKDMSEAEKVIVLKDQLKKVKSLSTELEAAKKIADSL